jgi:two-component sensor histidine kinase
VRYGQEPPLTGDPQTLRRMAETKQPVFSNLFTSLVVKKPVVNISIPVLSNGELRYALSLGLLPDELAALLADQTLNPNWVSVIWDANNRIVARSRDNNKHVGKVLPAYLLPQLGPARVTRTVNLDGEDVLYATSRSKIAGWGVGVNVPVKFLERPYHITAWLGTAALLAIILAVGLGILFARQLTKPLAAASKAASDLGRGQPITATHSSLKETELFLAGLHNAESQLSDRAALLRASEARMTAMVEQMPCGVGLTDRDGRWVIANQIMRHFVPKQLPSRNPERTKRWRGFDANGNPLDPSQWPGARALRGETVSPGVDFIYTNDEGKEQWVRIASAPFRDANGAVVGATTVIEDVSEQKRLAEMEKLLFRELQHRTNNLLGIIQAIAQKSLSGGRSVDQAREIFEARLQALARVHRELMRPNWAGVSLEEIVRLTLKPYAARVNIKGGAITLGQKDAQNFSLAIHELATNAVKYGALSNAQGRISVDWTLNEQGAGTVLRFKWQERGGPPVTSPERQGFGTTLLRATFSDIKIDYGSAGLTCEIELPFGLTDAEEDQHSSLQDSKA